MKVNRGWFFGDEYSKNVKFSKAVLWKDRELSLPIDIMDRIIRDGITTIIFKDPSKKEKWVFKTSDVTSVMQKKQVGQETQYYFPIELASKSNYEI